jgi:ComB9 competence protein
MNKKINIIALLTLFTVAANAGVVSDLFKGDSKASKFSLNKKHSVKLKKPTNLRHTQKAFKNSKLTANTANFEWAANKTFKIKTRLGTKTLVILPKDEEVKVFTLGDSKSFKVEPVGDQFNNILDIQSFVAGADTSLTVIGKTGRIYSFYIKSYTIKSKTLPHFMVYLKASPLYPEKGIQYVDGRNEGGNKLSKREKFIEQIKEDNDYLRALPDGEEIFIDYKMYGDKEIAPYASYDDGKWTYFDFRGQGVVESGRMPVVYRVIDGFDSIVNTRFEGGFIIAESINMKWTLKNGHKTVCIRAKSKKKFHKRFDRR